MQTEAIELEEKKHEENHSETGKKNGPKMKLKKGSREQKQGQNT